MPRPRTISDATILDAARLVFRRDGPGAPIAAIAREVGVSEATIFKRFPTKEALLGAALGCPVDLVSVRTVERVGQGELQAELEGMIGELIAFFREIIPRTMMLMASGGLDPLAFWRHANAGSGDGLQAGSRVVISRLAAWASGEMALGRLRPQPPEIVARTIAASCHHFVFLGLAGFGPVQPEAGFIKDLTSMLLHGIAPSATAAEASP